MKKQFLGVTLVVVGVLAMLQGLNMYNFGLEFWPVVMVIFGGLVMVSSLKRFPPQWFGLVIGGFLLAAGGLDIAHNAGLSAYGGSMITAQFWPVLLIAIGLSVLFGRRGWMVGKWHGKYQYKMIGDTRMGGDVWRLDKDLNLDHGIGDLRIDLTTAEITEGEHQIKVQGGIGDMVIRVPDNVNVTVKASVGVGDVTVFRSQRSGVSLSLEQEQVVAESSVHLHVRAQLGIGNLRVLSSPPPASRLITS